MELQHDIEREQRWSTDTTPITVTAIKTVCGIGERRNKYFNRTEEKARK